MERDAIRYTLVRTTSLRDPGLTWAEKGVLVYLTSHPDPRTLTVDGIAADGLDGPDVVSAALLTLAAKGLIVADPE